MIAFRDAPGIAALSLISPRGDLLISVGVLAVGLTRLERVPKALAHLPPLATR